MKKTLLTLASLAIIFNLLAQSTQKFYLELNTGEKIYANSTPVLKKKYFYLGNYIKYLNTEVKSYLGSDGYFQRIMNKSQTKADWYRLEQEGKINILSKQYIVDNSYYDGSTYLYSVPYSTKAFYFQDALFTAQEINYKNLVDRLSANPLSIKLLNEGKRLSNTKTTLVVLGTVAFVAGCLMGKTEKLDNGNTNFTPLPIAWIGAATCFVPLFMKNPKNKYKQAIEVFNR
jgi:hypothetical protein